MKHIIYDNYDISDEFLEECRQVVSENMYCDVSEVTDDQAYEEANESLNSWFDDEIGNLDMELDGRIIAIADLGLWDGRKTGYKIGGTNLKEIMTMGNKDCDYVKVYSDSHNIKKQSSHHDGTNYLLFRMIRENRNINNLLDKLYDGKIVTKSMLNYYTKSLVSDVNEIFGW
jgi:hypothetical protein